MSAFLTARRDARRFTYTRRLISLLLLSVLVTSGCTWKTRSLEATPPPTAQSSFIYDADGSLITTFRGEQNRLNAETLSEIPRVVIDAVVAIEDERFWQHQGVDLRGILRAARSNVVVGGQLQGASTITQQYVGQAFLDRSDRSVSRKLEEIALALQFERAYSKEFILLQYLNVVNFGEGAYGIIAAAKEYFGKEPAQLTLAESALLAGLIRAPSALNPYNNRQAALSRRNDVLDRMLANAWITQKEYDLARTEPLRLAPRVETLEETYEAAYFVEEVRQWILNDPIFGESVPERARVLFEGGLRIETTLDMDIQKAAEEALVEILPWEDGPTAAIVVIENATGYVRAIVGGRDFFGEDPTARFNLATQGGRQAGSAFKPFVLAAALEGGIQMSALYPAPSNIKLPIKGLDEDWEVKGGSRSEGSKLVTLKESLVRSYNTVFAQLMEDVTPEVGIEMASRLGIQSPLQPVLAAVLGSEDVSVLDMATAYSTLAREGSYIKPALVTRISSADGTLVYENSIQSKQVLDSRITAELTEVLTEVIDSGTGWRAQFGREAAGKTGTAENFGDAGFSGYTPQYTTSVWVGFAEGQIPMEPPTTDIKVYGGTYPAEIWREAMAAIHEQVDPRQFPESVPTTTTTQFPRQVQVPELRNLAPGTARDLLDAVYLYLRISELEHPEANRPVVINQLPLPGEWVPGGSEVVLQVAVPQTTPPPETAQPETEQTDTPQPSAGQVGALQPETGQTGALQSSDGQAAARQTDEG